MKPVYLLVGVPGSGKSWVCEQVGDRFDHVAHDDYQNGGYVEALLEAADLSEKPILAEAPFSISQIKEPLEEAGVQVHPVFILEEEETLCERYREREGRDIPKGHLTRQKTYAARAEEYGAFSGTSDEVLAYLKEQCRSRVSSRRKLG